MSFEGVRWFHLKHERTAPLTYLKIATPATVEVQDHRNLLAAWKQYGLVGRYRVEKPLTDAQRRRLPDSLRARLA